jgi:hypothetical protein
VSSPFFWRNVAVVLLVVGNFALAVRLLAWSGGHVPASIGVPIRAVGILYVVASALLVLLAGLFFCILEVFDDARATWRTADRWAGVQAGMTRQEVERTVGAPFQKLPSVRDGHQGEDWVYRLHPLGASDEGRVTFETPTPGAAAEAMRVVGRHPRDDRWRVVRAAWIPGGYTATLYARNIADAAAMLSLAGLLVLALLSILPFGARAGWRSWTLYTPLVAVLLGVLYELPQRGGWRFDRMFLLYPASALILAGWLVRLVIVLKTRA